MKTISTALFLLMIGCADNEPIEPSIPQPNPPVAEPPAPTPPSPYLCESTNFTVYVTPGMAPFLMSIRKGFAEWQEALSNKVTFDVGIKDTSATFQPCVINIVLDKVVDKAWASTDFLNSQGKNVEGVRSWTGIIYFDEATKNELDDATVRSIILHETGHIIGLDHDTSREHSTVMWPVLMVPSNIGCADVRVACTIWDCVPACEGNGRALPPK